MIAYTFVIFSAVFATLSAYPTGAPGSVCDDMTPQHGVDVQKSPLPYTVSADKLEASTGEVISIEISSSSGRPFKGYLVEVRDSAGKAVGSFEISSSDTNSHTLDCHGNPKSAVTQSNASGKTNVVLNWKAPNQPGEYQIFVTIVENYATFWARLPLQKIKIVS